MASISGAREAKIEDLHAAVVQDEDILRLQIPVHDPLVVRRGQSPGDLHCDLDCLADWQRSVGHTLAERLTLQQLGDGVSD